MLQVSWVKCGELPNSLWCDFTRVNLENVDTVGVYVIWHGGKPPDVVRVGQGNIKDRLTKHRAEKEILAYEEYGLYVTWAASKSNTLMALKPTLRIGILLW